MRARIAKCRAEYARRRFRRHVLRALALNKRGEARSDGLLLNNFDNRLQIEWQAREVHPWDRDLPRSHLRQLFAEQCLRDADAALQRLFATLAEIDVIQFKMLDPDSGALILSGTVTRQESMNLRSQSSAMRLKQLGVTFRLQNWRFEPLG
jgi:hypothetical protein